MAPNRKQYFIVNCTPLWSGHVCSGWHKYYHWAKSVTVLIMFTVLIEQLILAHAYYVFVL